MINKWSTVKTFALKLNKHKKYFKFKLGVDLTNRELHISFI